MPVVCIASVIVIAAATPAYAYLDAGTGSMVLQILLAGMAGLAVAVKMSWRRIQGLLARGAAPDAGEPPAGASAEATDGESR